MDLRETGAQEGQMCWNIYDICIIISEAHPFCKKQPPKTPKKTKEKQTPNPVLQLYEQQCWNNAVYKACFIVLVHVNPLFFQTCKKSTLQTRTRAEETVLIPQKPGAAEVLVLP